jgi:eukaryotic translation initiation factor 2C
MKETVKGFVSMMKACGMQADVPSLVDCQLPRKDFNDPFRKRAIAAIESSLKSGLKGRPTLIMIVLSNTDKTIYNGIKTLFDTKMDIHSVCVQASKIRKEKGQVCRDDYDVSLS